MVFKLTTKRKHVFNTMSKYLYTLFVHVFKSNQTAITFEYIEFEILYMSYKEFQVHVFVTHLYC